MNNTDPSRTLQMNVEFRRQPAARPAWPYFCIVIFVLSMAFLAIVPPFQAPDEFDHVKRAYMLTQGQVLLESSGDAPSGGTVDAALLDYMQHFVPMMGNANVKATEDQLATAGAVRWSGEDTFTSPTGTAYYFPAMYLPQAAGLSIGRVAGLSVGQSYKLARLSALLACVLLLATAFRLYPPPLGALAVLLLPMNLFLYSAAVLDALATSTAVLALSSFLCLTSRREGYGRIASIVLVVSVMAVASCRANMMPMLLLPFAAWWVVRERRLLIGAIIAMLFVVGWTLLTIETTVYPPGARAIDHSDKLLGYLLDPLGFAKILWNTVSDPMLRGFYIRSFIGVLGWLDAPLPDRAYPVLGLLVLSTVASTLTLRSFHWTRGILILVAAVAIVLTFLALLVQWTIGPADRIDGVQGRYFMIPALMVIYALTADATPKRSLATWVASGLVAALGAIGIYLTTTTLVARYHTSPQAVQLESRIDVSPRLAVSSAIPLYFDPTIASDPVPLSEVQIMIGTYGGSSTGPATLVLWTRGSQRHEYGLELGSLADNQYHRISVEPRSYVGGSIVSGGGEGISVYQSTVGPSLLSCLRVVTTDGRSIGTTGCP